MNWELNWETLPTRLTIWLALGAYSLNLLAHRNREHAVSLLFSSVGLVIFGLHIAFAYHDHYQWSHVVAQRLTTKQTFATTGVNTSVGIYINYLFGLAWLVEVVLRWMHRTNANDTNTWSFWIFHTFVQFMIFNGAIVFAPPEIRWLGVTMFSFNTWCLGAIYWSRKTE